MYFGKQRTNPAVSALYPVSGTGILFLVMLTALFGLVRFTAWLLGGGMGGLSAASVMVLDVLGAAYMARYLLVAMESSAEGYDRAPGPPDPREVEEVFGGALKLLAVLFFTLAPVLVVELLDLGGGIAPYLLVAAGSLYFPMGLLGMAITGDLTGSFPGKVIPGIIAAPIRYLPAAALSAGACLVLFSGHSGFLSGGNIVVTTAMDAGAAWLLLVMVHRMGVIHREEFELQAILPFPEPAPALTESAVPPRQMTEIERILAEREAREGPL